MGIKIGYEKGGASVFKVNWKMNGTLMGHKCRV